MTAALLVPVLLLTHGALAAPPAEETGTAALWRFEGDLRDASGNGRDLAGAARLGTSPDGRPFAAFEGAAPLTVPDTSDLRLAPGLTIDAWVYFPERPTRLAVIAAKADEYQLRVDPPAEGGQFSFFVHLDGWEPRVSLSGPEPGRWHHVTAAWSGSRATLEVDGRKVSQARSGNPTPRGASLELGPLEGWLGETSIGNPNSARRRLFERLDTETAAGDRLDRAAFDGPRAWDGWRAELGAEAADEDGVLTWTGMGPAALLRSPALDVDVAGLGCLTLAIDSAAAENGELVFLTTAGWGALPFPIWPEGRASILDVASHPNWHGRLRYLGIGLPPGPARGFALRGVWLAERPAGPPWVYVRNLAPGRAVLRAGREEQVIATVRNLGAEGRDLTARLEAPEGVTLLDPAEQRVATLANGSIEQLVWRLRAERPSEGTARVVVAASGQEARTSELALRFLPPCTVGPLEYVPPPAPASTPYTILMHYCPLWKEGTHAGWGKIEPWPERRPAIGWYDEGTPEVADWHIKQALEHGIQGFIYCWYRSDWSAEIHEMLGHALHDGLLHARYLDQFRFAIMWENANAKGVRDRADLLENVFPYWLERFLRHPSYARIGGKPVLVVYAPSRLTADLGGPEEVRSCFEEMRRRCREAGLGGLTILGCLEVANPTLQERMRAEGYDASTAYSVSIPTRLETRRDPDGAATIPYARWIEEEKQVWLDKKAASALPDIPTVMMGWDPRPWHGLQTTFYREGVTPELFRDACRAAKEVVDATTGDGPDRGVVILDNWNEFGEGHYIEPCAGYGFALVDAVREVFCEPGEPHEDLLPEDVGLAPPERAYAHRRAVMGLAGRQRTVHDHLVGSWSFDEEDPLFVLDGGGCGFHAAKRDARFADGHRGRALLCGGGTAVVESDPLLFPATGLTIELWANVAKPRQTDRWMVNTVQMPQTGYRLGLDEGYLVWQVPQTDWSHSLRSSEPLPVGAWVHIVATFDNRALRLYVNGAPQGELARPGTIHPSRADLVLGSFAPAHPAAFFVGFLDEVRLYDYALTPDEVRARAPR